MASIAHDMSRAWIQSLPAGYRQWNQALADHFFSLDQAGRPVYLDIDDDVLSEIAGIHGWPVESASSDFTRAVGAALGGDGYHKILGRCPDEDQLFAYRWCENQARIPDTLPFVALLGLTALAASHMQSAGGLAVNAYYARLNELLPGIRHVSDDYPRIVKAWNALNFWLDDTLQGTRGRGTALEHPKWKRIGYALSQCMIRQHDRRQLPAFFRWANLEPTDQIAEMDLAQLLKAWLANSSCRFTQHGRDRLRNDALRPIIAGIAGHELRAWSGDLAAPPPAESGRSTPTELRCRVAPALLLLEHVAGLRVALTLLPRRPDGFPPTLDFQGGSAIQALDDLPFYEPLQPPAHFCSTEWVTSNRQFSIRFELGSIAVLVEDQALGRRWRQVTRLDFDQEAVVLAAPDHAASIERVLRRAALPGWQRVELAGLPEGWNAFWQVRITNPFEVTDPDLACLSPLARIGASLAGGLRLNSQTWLLGGAPMVNVRNVLTSKGVEVYFDDHPQSVATLPPEGGSFDLQRLEPGQGHHQVRVGETSLAFHIREGRAEPRFGEGYQTIVVPLRREANQLVPGPPSERRSAEMGPAGLIRIRGAEIIALPDEAPTNSLPPAASEDCR